LVIFEAWLISNCEESAERGNAATVECGTAYGGIVPVGVGREEVQEGPEQKNRSGDNWQQDILVISGNIS
jgi:hypothetical protein